MTEQVEKIVAEAHVGNGKVLSENQNICFHFHDFADLPHKRGEEIVSPSLPCHGHKWNLDLYPRGHVDSDEEDVYISAFLCCETNKVTARFAVRVSSAGYETKRCQFHHSDDDAGVGNKHFLMRDIVLNPATNFLVNGTLSIEVDIQVYLTKPERWTFNKTPQPEWLRMLDESQDLADVAFAIGDAKFHAHRCVLRVRAPGLAELAEEYPSQKVPIDDVDPSIFQVFRHFIYSHGLPRDFNLDQESAKTLLIVADKYGCSSLKLLAEAKLVETAITVDTAADLLVLADCMNCALLKEAVVSFFVANSCAVLKSKGFLKVKESAKLLFELMQATLVGNESHNDDNMGVASLRRKLDEAGHDVDAMDGTREMLVKRLKTAHKDES